MEVYECPIEDACLLLYQVKDKSSHCGGGLSMLSHHEHCEDLVIGGQVENANTHWFEHESNHYEGGLKKCYLGVHFMA